MSTKFQYTGWYGVKELPELKQDENGISEGPKNYIFEITKRWMDPNNDGNTGDGIDGWRLDVAFMIKHNFWKDWRKHVKSINPDAYITAEIIDSIQEIKPYLEGDEFDAVMNYNFAFICSEFFINDKTRISVSKFDTLLRELRNAFPDNINYVMQNLFDSHDTNRLLSHIVNKDLGKFRDWPEYFEKSKGSNPKYQKIMPNEEEIGIQKLMAIFQFTYLGAPMIYYGDEAGMWGANDPDCRKPMLWDDIEYDVEKYLPDQSEYKNPQKVKFNNELFNHYKKLAEIRNNSNALQLGDIKVLLINDSNGIYIFERNFQNEKVIVAINNGNSNYSAKLKMLPVHKFLDKMNDEVLPSDNSGILEFNIKPKWGRIIKDNI